MDTENLIKKVHEKQINVLSEQVCQLLNMVVNLQNENVRLRKEIDKSSISKRSGWKNFFGGDV